MRRGNPVQTKTPDLILTSDWHLREDTPVCRTDDFWDCQWEKVSFIIALQEQIQRPILHAGDLFHHWKPSPLLLSATIFALQGIDFRTIYGQHDLPQHNLKLADKCGIQTLKEAGVTKILRGVHYGEEPHECLHLSGCNILIWHKLIWPKENKPSWSDDPTAWEILEKYPQYDLIVTGDNHQSFVWETDGKLLVNPGSITRQSADQENHKPCVYLWYANTNTVEPVYLPIEDGVISREHIERKESRDRRIEAFVERLNQEWEAAISFTANLEAFQKKNKVRKDVMDIIWKAVE